MDETGRLIFGSKYASLLSWIKITTTTRHPSPLPILAEACQLPALERAIADSQTVRNSRARLHSRGGFRVSGPIGQRGISPRSRFKAPEILNVPSQSSRPSKTPPIAVSATATATSCLFGIQLARQITVETRLWPYFHDFWVVCESGNSGV